MAKEKRQRIRGRITTDTITTGMRHPNVPFEFPYKDVECEDGQIRRWWYDESKFYLRKDDIIEATINKFGRLCKVKLIGRGVI